jgi:hypothetical protein
MPSPAVRFRREDQVQANTFCILTAESHARGVCADQADSKKFSASFEHRHFSCALAFTPSVIWRTARWLQSQLFQPTLKLSRSSIRGDLEPSRAHLEFVMDHENSPQLKKAQRIELKPRPQFGDAPLTPPRRHLSQSHPSRTVAHRPDWGHRLLWLNGFVPSQPDGEVQSRQQVGHYDQIKQRIPLEPHGSRVFI